MIVNIQKQRTFPFSSFLSRSEKAKSIKGMKDEIKEEED